MDLLPDSTWAPTLYRLGCTAEEWAAESLKFAKSDRLIVVGCSIGGSCALEVAAAAPERIAALVLISTKAAHSPDPALHASALELLEREGIDAVWAAYWAPLFSRATDPGVIEAAQQTARRQLPGDIANGLDVFHSRPTRDAVVANCSSPIIVVAGEDDIAPGPEASAALAATAQQGQCHVVPSCGHYVPLEKPQALRAILGELIDTQLSQS